MKIDEELLKYLSGERFRTNLIISIERKKYPAVSREKVIVDTIRNKKVIHIGCSDHLDVIEEKIKNNIWLHKLITEAASECIGIDIDAESIDFIRNNLKYSNVFKGNILTDDFKEVIEKKWDVAVFGEIIEHLDDPVSFLRSFREKYHDHVSSFIVTVPNVFSSEQFNNMLRYQEIINSDHRFWFTPYTISRVLMSAGFIPEEIVFANRQNLSITELFKRKLLTILRIESKYPYYYFRTLIISGKISTM